MTIQQNANYLNRAHEMIALRKNVQLRQRRDALYRSREKIIKALAYIHRSLESCKREAKREDRKTQIPIDIMVQSRLKSLEDKKKTELEKLAKVDAEIAEIESQMEALEVSCVMDRES